MPASCKCRGFRYYQVAGPFHFAKMTLMVTGCGLTMIKRELSRRPY